MLLRLGFRGSVFAQQRMRIARGTHINCCCWTKVNVVFHCQVFFFIFFHYFSSGFSPNATSQCIPNITVSIQITLTVLYVVVFPMALLGNSLVLHVVVKRQSMRNVLNLSIVNMAIADLLITVFVMPYSVYFLFAGVEWFGGLFGLILCKMIHFSLTASIAASVITLIVITVDRFVSIVFVWKRFLNLKTSKISLVVIWVFSIAVMGLNLHVYTAEQALPGDDRYYCYPDWKRMPEDFGKFFAVATFIMLYAIPLVLMAVLYSVIANNLWRQSISQTAGSSGDANINSSKKRVIKMLVTITIAFAVCWLPLHTIHYFIYFDSEAFQCFSQYFVLLSFWLGHANSAINPVLYVVFNKTFRRAFLHALHIQKFDSVTLKSTILRHRNKGKHSFRKETIQSVLVESEHAETRTVISPASVTPNVGSFKNMYAYGKLVQPRDDSPSSNSSSDDKKASHLSLMVVMDKITSV